MGAMRTRGPQVIVLSVCALVLLSVLVIVFVRASIEVGEERLWLWLYLLAVPVLLALGLAWALSGYRWPIKLVAAAATLAIVAILLVQTVVLADKIYENPASFRPILPLILRAEALYLAIASADTDRYTRHIEKAKRWGEVAG